MNIDPNLLRFPKTLPNDIEGFIFTYPNKFPQIVSYYEEVAQKIALDPTAFQEYGNWARNELWEGFKKIKAEFEAGDQNSLERIVETDMRLNKLCCFRFWVVNYLFADGPLHDFFVDNLKNYIRKFIEVTEDVEDFEHKVIRIQRDLLQSDYADLYLRQALNGVELLKKLEIDPNTKEALTNALNIIESNVADSHEKLKPIWDMIIDKVLKEESNSDLQKLLAIPLEQSEYRKTRIPLYNMFTQAVEFKKQNEDLLERYNGMKEKIDLIMQEAQSKLSPEDFKMFKVSYEQARNFGMYKDVMGEIDPQWLPFWFGLHDKAVQILSKTTDIKPRGMGHAALFYYIVWYLPDNLKGVVMTPDTAPFTLESL